MTKLYLVRHAESEGNLYGRAHGLYDCHLTKLGREQAKLLARRLKDVPFDVFYSSPLHRAKQTALAVMEGREGAVLNIEPDLHELGVGVWEDKTWTKIAQTDLEMLIKYYTDMADWDVDGGEKFDAVRQRMRSAVDKIVAENRGKTILCTSHGFAIFAYDTDVRGIPSKDALRRRFCGNTAIYAYNIHDDGRIEPTIENDCAHLKAAGENMNRSGDISTIFSMSFDPLDFDADGDLCGKWCPDIDMTRLKILAHANPRAVVTAYCRGEAAGIVILDTERENSSGAGHIEYIYLDEKFRNRKFSRALIGHAVSVYRGEGRDKIRVIIPAENTEIIGYFNHYGFETMSDGESVTLDYDLLI